MPHEWTSATVAQGSILREMATPLLTGTPERRRELCPAGVAIHAREPGGTVLL